jgi:uncharacterized lipoprotein YbaY
MKMDLRIYGEVTLGPEAPSFEAARLRTRLIDATYADAPSQTIVEAEEPDVAHTAGTWSHWPIHLEARELDPQKRYRVEAHLSRCGEREIHAGDFYSSQSHPVGEGNCSVIVPMSPVG